MSRLIRAFSLSLCFGGCLFAQSCPHGNPDYQQLTLEVEQTPIPDRIYRAAAIGGSHLISVLRSVSKERDAKDAVAEAAQVALARLRDTGAMDHLEQELRSTPYPSKAVHKIVRVGNDWALSVLMTYLGNHLDDSSLFGNSGDYGYDLRAEMVELIAKQMQAGPLTAYGRFSELPKDWLAWWAHNKGKEVAVSVSSSVDDPYLNCLARKVEWGFPNAIFDMANLGSSQAVPVLKKLESVGQQTFNLNTIHGRAQFALARLGDEQAFQAIVHDLDFGEFTQCISALQLLGGSKAVAALIAAFDSPNFLGNSRSRLTADTIARYEKDRDMAITSALHMMIVKPPDADWKPDEMKPKWKEWWTTNQHTTQFVIPLVKTYE